jgi:hypothetical protein
MNMEEAKLKILAQAVYELRLLLSHHIGPSEKIASPEVASANLVYALHNEAEAIIENRPKDFKIDEAIEKIRKAELLSGGKYTDQFQELMNEIET